MANTSSAKKAARQAVRRTEVNKARKTKLRSVLRKVEDALASGVAADASVAMSVAESMIMRSTQNGVLHKNTAARKISRLTTRVKALSA